MAYFPLFIELRGRLCVCVGGGAVAQGRVGTLLRFGAEVRLVSPRLTDGLEALARAGRLHAVRRDYTPGDLEGAFLALAASDDPEVNAAVGRDAAERGIQVNAADAPRLCTFYFPALVKRGDFVAGISTGGASPGLSKKIRQRFERAVPENMEELLAFLRRYRELVRRREPDPAERRAILDRSVDYLLSSDGWRGMEPARLLDRMREGSEKIG